MYDRRSGWEYDNDAWCFDTQFSDENKVVEIQVNREFSEAEALTYAEFYGEAIGRVPKMLRKDLDTVWIHAGNNAFGGGNRNFLIHTEQGEWYIRNGILDETFIHEGAHTSLDSYVYGTDAWEAAVELDMYRYVSDYARDNP